MSSLSHSGILVLALGALAAVACSDDAATVGSGGGGGASAVASGSGGDGQGGATAGGGDHAAGGSDSVTGTGGSAGIGGDSGGTGGETGGTGGSAPDGVAPAGTIAGEQQADDGDNEVTVAAGDEAVLRLEVGPDEHLGFFLTFEPGIAGVVLELSRWDGAAPEVLAFTDGGSGLRTLAAVDASGPRTFWLRVTADEAFDGTLEVVRTPYQDAPQCSDDCERLLQLPVRNDPAVDGYDWTPSTIFRYQFGRRDMLMLLRHAAREMALAGRDPILPEDLSQWDGLTPGSDVGAPRHASHQNGKDVDISLYGTDGLSAWRSYCDAVNDGDGRECEPGSVTGFDGRANAEMYAAFLQSGRVTMSFLDGELIPPVQDGAEEAAAEDALSRDLLPLYTDGVHLQHWPNHDNHIHVRLSEQPYDGSSLVEAPFAAP
jgi:hypothetical protein